MTDAERRVLDRIGESEVVEVAQRLVRAPGQNPPGGEAATAAVLEQVCRERGLAVEVVDVAPERPNLRAVLAGGAGPGLLLLGHTDVVPVGDGWTVDPFGGEVRDGRLYGRGSTDMKGGLAACVVAMTALRREGVVLSGPVELAALVDEEEHGLGIRRFVAENGGAYAACVVAEPTDLQTIIAARGDAYLDIVVHGSAAHSGRPDDGRNAIYGGAAVIASLQRWHEELTHAAHPLVGPPTWSVGLVAGGQGVSTVPAVCRIGADRRLLPGESAAQVLADLRRPRRGTGARTAGAAGRGRDVHGHARLRDAVRITPSSSARTPPSAPRAAPGSRSAAGRRPATAASWRATSASRPWCSARVRSTTRPTAATSRSASRSWSSPPAPTR